MDRAGAGDEVSAIVGRQSMGLLMGEVPSQHNELRRRRRLMSASNEDNDRWIPSYREDL